MKLSVQKLGFIQSAGIDLAPFTVFVGPNNTNKTWTAYALYGLLKSLTSRPPFFGNNDFYYDLVDIPSTLRTGIRELAEAIAGFLLRATDSEVAAFEVSRNQLLGNVQFPLTARISAKGLARVLAADEATLSGAEASLSVGEAEAQSSLQRIAFSAQKLSDGLQIKATATGLDGETESLTQFSMPVGHAESLVKTYVNSSLRYLAFADSEVIAFPAERKLLATIHNFGRRADRPSRAMIDYSSSGVSSPIVDYDRLLAQFSRTKRILLDSPVNLTDVAGNLESTVLLGKVGFRSDTRPRVIEYSLADGGGLNLGGVSSVVKSLAGLDMYINGVARAGDTIVIDEPEMNAHPEAQLAIAELLCVLVKRGVRIVVTTHSPYVADHINNLVEAAKLSDSRKPQIIEKLTLQCGDALLPREMVAMYWFGRGGVVKPLYDENMDAFDLSTFGNVSDRLSNLYSDILNARGEG